MNALQLALWAQLPGQLSEMEFGRVARPVDWLIPGLIFAGILMFVIWMYRKDSVELPGAVGVLLAALRILAFTGLLLIYLQPQWPNERIRVENSRVPILIDTSLSMRYPADESPASQGGPTRSQVVKDMLVQSNLLEQLSEKHDVLVLSYDQEPQDPQQRLLIERGAFGPQPDSDQPQPSPLGDKRWLATLDPKGSETRLGQSLKRLIADERTRPTAGIVVIGDFGQNAGIGAEAAIEAAKEAKLPIFTVGLGSNQLPANVLVELHAPQRAYPNDPYQVEGLVQSQGLAGQVVQVELYSRPAGDANAVEELEGSQSVILAEDGKPVSVQFTIADEEAGPRHLRLQIDPPAGDRNKEDDLDEAEIEIVDRRTRVLLLAGGPLREYRFLRDMLHRSSDTEVDVLLQSARTGVSQDAREILDAFPATKQELYEYDCVIAFDPDWTALGGEAIERLADWVAKEAGGLVVVSGPIYTRRWSRDSQMDTVRALYPVEFPTSFANLFGLDETPYGAKEPAPLEFTSEGLQADFLQIEDTPVASQGSWDQFDGVYGYERVEGPKPAATVYARYSDPSGDLPEESVYFAGHYYGQGRVFYLGSAEMWRLRSIDPAFFERLYTKLIQHVTSGRLSRDSARGELLVDSSTFSLGNVVNVTARLRNEQLDPLVADSVRLDVLPPTKVPMTVELDGNPDDPNAAGIFRGQFTARDVGMYHLELLVPGTVDEIIRRAPLEVVLPDLEKEHRRRNDTLLKGLAQETDGEWYLSLAALVSGEEGKQPLADLLKDRTRTITEEDSPTRLWDNEQYAMWAMYLICGLLCLEWIVRRLAKLA